MKKDKIIEELNKLLNKKETFQSFNRDNAQLISLTEQIKLLKWNLAMRICGLK